MTATDLRDLNSKLCYNMRPLRKLQSLSLTVVFVFVQLEVATQPMSEDKKKIIVFDRPCFEYKHTKCLQQ